MNKMKIVNMQDIIDEKEHKNDSRKLFAIGNINLLYENKIAIVGSRNCSEYGLRIAEQFSYELAIKGISIVSGMAKGIDTAAHIGAIKANGKTIAVLGGGFHKIYPEENQNLFQSIIENGGLVVTEHDWNEEAKSENFPKRNKIIVAISKGILVAEAKAGRSGASLTAHIAMEKNKKVFCIPSSLENRYKGANQLIKEGAILVTTPEEIIKECDFIIKNECKKRIKNRSPLVLKKQYNLKEIPMEYQEIYKILLEEGKSIDEIIRQTNKNISEIVGVLTMMELEEIIERIPGEIFKIKEKSLYV